MILDKIVARKKITLKEHSLNLIELKAMAKDMSNRASFYDAMAKDGLSIIGEIKKASPSKGIIVEDFKPGEIALEYKDTVDAISVLTEEHFFLGSPEYLKQASKTVSLPLLRKDFIIDSAQIYEAKTFGASCILLITAILEKNKIEDFIGISKELGMDALVEVHTEEEVEIALLAGAKIIGINNRNLKDFSIDLNTTVRLSSLIPSDRLIIGESGVHTKDDILILKQAKINGILVGESFMRSGNILEKAKEFRNAFL